MNSTVTNLATRHFIRSHPRRLYRSSRMWWAYLVAWLVMVPIIPNEGMDGLRGRAFCDD